MAMTKLNASEDLTRFINASFQSAHVETDVHGEDLNCETLLHDNISKFVGFE